MCNKKIISSIIISLMLISTVFITGCMDDGDEGGDTPEELIVELVQDMNDDDYQGVLNQTDFKFNKTYYNHTLKEIKEDDLEEIKINSIDVNYEEDMNETIKENVQENIPKLEENLSVEVDNFCSIEMNFTRIDSGQTDDIKFVSLYIDSEWYISYYLMYHIDSGSSNTDNTTKSLSGRITLFEEGWVVEIDAGTVDWSADMITFYNHVDDYSISKAEGTTGFKNEPGVGYDLDKDGTDDVAVVWEDIDFNGKINAGDKFQITYKDTASVSQEDIQNYVFRLSGTSLQYMQLHR